MDGPTAYDFTEGVKVAIRNRPNNYCVSWRWKHPEKIGLVTIAQTHTCRATDAERALAKFYKEMTDEYGDITQGDIIIIAVFPV